MRVVILGSSLIGATLAEKLSGEKIDVVMIDDNYDALKLLRKKIDIQTYLGNPSYPEIMREAGCDLADILIAVTDYDEINMIACQIAYSLFKTPTKIARISSPHYLIKDELFGNENLPIDIFINPEEMITLELLNLIAYPGAKECHEIGHKAAKLILLDIDKKSKVVGKKLTEIKLIIPDIPYTIPLVFRHHKLIQIKESTRLMAGDEIYLLAHTHDVKYLIPYFCQELSPIQTIMIAGGGNIGSFMAKKLENNHRIILIEKDKLECKRLSETLSNTTVIHDDCTDKDLLINENIGRTDLFCAMTNDDAINMISSMQAEQLGARQTLTLINHTNYSKILHHSHLNTVISPQQMAISQILKTIRQGQIDYAYSLKDGSIEVIEIVIQKGTQTGSLIGKFISDIKLPKGIDIVGIIHKKRLIIPTSASQLKNDDHLVIFTQGSDIIKKIDSLFKQT